MTEHSFEDLDSELEHAAHGFAETGSRDALVHGCKVIKHLLAHLDWGKQTHKKQAILLNQGGGCHLHLFKLDGDPKLLNGALQILGVAVKLKSVPGLVRGSCLSNYGMALRNAAERFGEKNLLDEAIGALEEAVNLIASTDERVRALTNLGMAHYYRFTLVSDLADIETAHAHLKTAFDEAGSDDTKARIATNRSIVDNAGFQQTGARRDLEAAVRFAELAVSLTPAGHRSLGIRLNNLGIALGNRYGFSGDVRDIETAAEAFERALVLIPESHTEYPMRALNLGNARYEIYRVSSSIAALDQAIEALRIAARLGDSQHGDFVAIEIALANAIARQSFINQDRPMSDESVNLAFCAVAKSSDEPERKRRALMTVASVLRLRGIANHDKRDLEAARTAISEAIALNADAPFERQLATITAIQVEIASLSFVDDPSEKVKRAQKMRHELRTLDHLLSRPGGARVVAETLTSVRAELRAVAMRGQQFGLAIELTEDARAVALRRDIALAEFVPAGLDEIEALEFGTTRNRLRAIGAFLAAPAAAGSAEQRVAIANEADVLEQKFDTLLQKAGFEEPVAETLQTVRNLAREVDSLFVYVYIGYGEKPGGALMLRGDHDGAPEQSDFVPIPELNERAVFGRLFTGLEYDRDGITKALKSKQVVKTLGLATLYQASRSQDLPHDIRGKARHHWEDRLVATIEWINHAVAKKVAEKAVTANVRRIVLLPDARLLFLPLHAAQHFIDGDWEAVTYAPSAGFYRSLLRRPQVQTPPSVVGVFDKQSDLLFAGAEISAVLKRFKSTGARGRSGSGRKWLQRYSGDADILFLSTHAVFNPVDPYASEFEFGPDDQMSLASILAGGLKLKSGVVLFANACETGAIGPRLAAEEHLGFSAALLASGARFVGASAWAVNDVAAALFSLETAERLADGMDPIAAAYSAIRALAKMDRATAKRRLGELRQAAPNLRDTLSIALTAISFSEKEAQDLRHPKSWACFFANGVA